MPYRVPHGYVYWFSVCMFLNRKLIFYQKNAKELYRELQIYQRVFNNITRSLLLPLMLGMFDAILTFSGYSLIAHYKTLEFFSLIMLFILLVYSLLALSLFKFMELFESTCADFSRQLKEQSIWLRNKNRKFISETHKFAQSLLPPKGISAGYLCNTGSFFKNCG